MVRRLRVEYPGAIYPVRLQIIPRLPPVRVAIFTSASMCPIISRGEPHAEPRRPAEANPADETPGQGGFGQARSDRVPFDSGMALLCGCS